MTRLLAAAGIAGAATLVALWLGRREASVGGGFGTFPPSVDLARLGLSGSGLLVFVDNGCASCARALDEVLASGRPHVVVDDPAARAAAGVHDVPTTLDVDAAGVVLRGWVGPPPAGVLRAPA